MASDEQIRELAYYIWQQEGYPDGKASKHYFRAKQMLEDRKATSLSAKNQVPPASTLPPSSSPKPIDRHIGKSHSKKA